MLDRTHLTRGLVAAAVLGLATPASATIIAWSLDAVKIAPPPSVTFGALESNTDMPIFDENGTGVDCVLLEERLYLDGETFIEAGTEIECHFFHVDPLDVAGTYAGRARFDGQILGVIDSDVWLDASDAVCGVAGTTYPTGDVRRGLSNVVGEGWAVNTTNDGIEIHTRTGLADFDQVRVITECNDLVVSEDYPPEAGA